MGIRTSDADWRAWAPSEGDRVERCDRGSRERGRKQAPAHQPRGRDRRGPVERLDHESEQAAAGPRDDDAAEPRDGIFVSKGGCGEKCRGEEAGEGEAGHEPWSGAQRPGSNDKS